MTEVTFAKATQDDFSSIFELIEELKTHYGQKKEKNEFFFSKEDFLRVFEKNPFFEILLAKKENKTLALGLYSYCFDSFRGKALYLDTLVVSSLFRGKNIGRELVREIIKKALENEVKVIFWESLKTNQKANKFYKSIGASLDGDQFIGRLDKKGMEKFLHP